MAAEMQLANYLSARRGAFKLSPQRVSVRISAQQLEIIFDSIASCSGKIKQAKLIMQIIKNQASPHEEALWIVMKKEKSAKMKSFSIGSDKY